MPFPLGCKNICERLKIMNAPRYSLGYKFCRVCEAAFITTKRTCQCCGRWLRIRRHSGRNKRERAGHSSLDKRIRRRATNRRYYLKNAKKLIAGALERYYRKKKANNVINKVQVPVISYNNGCKRP